MSVSFLTSNEESRKTRWRWCKGEGELSVDGEQLTLSGRRWRPFLRGTPQSVTFRRDQIVDVVRVENRLACAVKLDGTVEPLALQFESEEVARQMAAGWPEQRSVQSVEHQAFSEALERTGIRVLVTPVLLAACALLFVVMALSGVPVLDPAGPELIPWGSNFGPRTLGGEPWRLFTSMFLHFGLIHLALNFWVLLTLGPLTERLLGNLRFLMLYVVAGLCGSMASLLWNPDVNSAGASGAIFGVIGALLAVMLNPRSRVPASIAKAHRNSALAFIAYNVMIGLSHAGIDNAAHLGGLAGGFVMGWFLAKPLPEAGQAPTRVAAWPAAVVAAVMMAALAWPLLLPGVDAAANRAFQFALREFSAAEAAALSQEDELRKLVDGKEVNGLEWGRRTLAQSVPLWEKAMDAAEQLPQDGATLQRDLRRLLMEFSSAQAMALQLHAESRLDEDPAKEVWANNLDRAQHQRVIEARAMIEKL
jgi:rhomboid protease GluP